MAVSSIPDTWGGLIPECWNRGVPGDLISEGWNREVPLYTEVSSFQGVGIECIQRCPHFRVLE